MKLPRRRLLLILASLLGIADAVLLWQTLRPIYAPITYIGLDSLHAIVPVSQKGATLRHGKWQPAASDAQFSVQDMLGNNRPLTLVTLTSDAPYGNLIDAIKSLRAQGKCNVLVRGSDEEGLPRDQVQPGGKDLIIPALVLCEDAIGDAGFHGTLPPDGLVRID